MARTHLRNQIQDCYATSYAENKIVCWNAVLAANQGWVDTLFGSSNPYYVRSNENYPPSVTPYLSNAALQAKIGAQGTYNDTNIYVAYSLEEGGVWLHDHSQEIANLINKGISTLFWVGDAVSLGVHAMSTTMHMAKRHQCRTFTETIWLKSLW